jgi:hypothetical protein
MRKVQTLFALFIAISLSACSASRGLQKDQIFEQLRQIPLVEQTEQEKNESETRPKTPLTIAVHFIDPSLGRRTKSGNALAWHWTEKNRASFLPESSLPQKIRNQVRFINLRPEPPASESLSLAELQKEAAQKKADALLVVVGASDTDTFTTDLAWTYFLLLPMLFVPASRTEVIFQTRASLWAINSPHLFLSAEADSLSRRDSPLAFIREQEQIIDAKTSSIQVLGKKVAELLSSFLSHSISP